MLHQLNVFDVLFKYLKDNATIQKYAIIDSVT